MLRVFESSASSPSSFYLTIMIVVFSTKDLTLALIFGGATIFLYETHFRQPLFHSSIQAYKSL